MKQKPASRVQVMDRSTIRMLQGEIDAAIAGVAERHGISLKLGRCTFDRARFTLKVEGAVIGEDGMVDSREAETFRQIAPLVGLAPEDLGRQVVIDRTLYTIVGMKPRSTSNKVLIERPDKKRFAIGAQMLKLALAADPTRQVATRP